MACYTLKHPVTIDGVTVESVILRRPKVKDAIASGKALKASGDDGEATAALVASLSGLDISTVLEFDLEDMTAISEELGDFFPSSPREKSGDQ